MKNVIGWCAILVVLMTAMGSALAQQRRSRYFFLPPRNLFFANSSHFAPFIYYPPVRYGFYGSPYIYRGSRGFARSRYLPYPGEVLNGRLGYDSPQGVYSVTVRRPFVREVVRVNTADLVFKVDPPSALIYVDDKLIGSAGDFSSQRERYSLLSGEHELRIEHPNYKPFLSRMKVVPNKTLHLDIELEEK